MSDDRFGVVLRARDAWASTDELHALGVRCVRTDTDDLRALEAVLREHPADVRVVVTLNASSGPFTIDLSHLDSWETTINELGALAHRVAGRIWALECLGDWARLGIDPEVVVAYARSAARILRDTGSGIRSLLGSVGGPHWISRLCEIADLLTPEDRTLLGGACFQPFGKNARGFPGFGHSRYDHGEIDVAVQNAFDLVGLPIWVTGFGVTLGQAGGEAGQARYVRDAVELLRALPPNVLAAATYHCWSDRVDARSERGERAAGLRRDEGMASTWDGTIRPAWHAFAEVMGGTGVEPLCFEARLCDLVV